MLLTMTFDYNRSLETFYYNSLSPVLLAMITRQRVANIVNKYDLKNITIGTIGSHSALESEREMKIIVRHHLLQERSLISGAVLKPLPHLLQQSSLEKMLQMATKRFL